MTFAQHLVLWLHISFAVFTIGPLTLATMSTPRYIRQGNIVVVRYLSRITFAFTVVCLTVLIAGFALAGMLQESAKPWVIISATLFVVAFALLVLVHRDQRRAIRALEEAAAAPAEPDEPGEADEPEPGAAGPAQAGQGQIPSVLRSRIAMLGGVVSLLWLVILVLMVWQA